MEHLFNSVPPFVVFYITAVFAFVLEGRTRTVFMLAGIVLSALNLLGLSAGDNWQLQFMSFELTPVRVDQLSLLFGYLFHIAALIGVIYAIHVKDAVQQSMSLLYAGSALGAVFAGDLLTLFLFWEVLAVSSAFLIWARQTDTAFHAGMRYLIIQVLSGVILLAGAIFYFVQQGNLSFDYIGLNSVAGWLIFIAFGIKCAFPFVHNWLTDAYPESTPIGTVFLSAFTTKVAVYSLARGFPGTELLVYIGAVMACFPIFYAVIENDLRRVLAYSLVNQLGFMVVGIGIGTALSLNGAVAHAFTDVIFKGLLFMSMGAVLHMTGRINGSELGGLYKSMPKTTLLCIIGAASISAFPLFSGFISKSMIMTAALQEKYNGVWLILLFASAGVFHHAGIKIPYFAFFAHDSGIRTTEPPKNMLFAMFIAATLCVGLGMFPQTLYQLLPYQASYTAYDVTHVLTQLQLLCFSALAFVWLNQKGLYPPELPSVNLEFDWLYRRALPVGALVVLQRLKAVQQLVYQGGYKLYCQLGALEHNRQVSKVMVFSQSTAGMVTWLALLLTVFLLVGVV
ncbi:Na(+)/H(+) antiporter subunit D [Neptunicella marina]|uniref:Na(+)/H(+) antiporter subunit D n=1 Tax=Neptunicella marina TaxID=2125989 RepID=A0A8J6M1I7_9ALTE|nr:Na(+)/H(+) antiporter subunit D [Neptunicella marina]MBC3765518.1 Na(+)/H(+) antiporter subunit D [Neptunicella marina]